MRRGLTNEMVNVVLCCSAPAVLAVSTLGSTTERIASDFLDALPVQNDFEAAALAGALTDIQQIELHAVIMEFEQARSTLLKRTATQLEPACELIMTIPKSDDQYDHLDTLEEFGIALERAKISVSGDVLALRRDLHNQAMPFLGPNQTNLWRDALDSAVRNRVLDPKNRSAEDVDLSAARDLETIPDLQLIASWAIRSSDLNMVDPKLLEQVTDRLSEGAKDIQAAFDRWHQSRIIDTIRMQLAAIRGDHRKSQALTKKVQRRWADILGATLETSHAIAAMLDAGDRPDLAQRWIYETNRRAFPTVFGRNRVGAIEDLLVSDTSISPQQRLSITEVAVLFDQCRGPILKSMQASLLHALQSGSRLRSELVLLRGFYKCLATADADNQYRELIDSAIQSIADILDYRQKQVHAEALKQFSNRCDATGDQLIW
jgi:hypothetical protein